MVYMYMDPLKIPTLAQPERGAFSDLNNCPNLVRVPPLSFARNSLFSFLPVANMHLSTLSNLLIVASVAAVARNPAGQDHKDDKEVTVVGSVVNTTSGPVTGHAAPRAPQVSEYLGIPYAEPPLGQLRFAAPQRFQHPRPINASSFVNSHWHP